MDKLAFNSFLTDITGLIVFINNPRRLDQTLTRGIQVKRMFTFHAENPPENINRKSPLVFKLTLNSKY